MTPERWQQIDKLLEQALEQDRDRRELFLDSACADDDELRREVETLLKAHDQGGSVLSSPVLAVATQKPAGSPQSLMGHSLSHYQIVSRLGEGGMGIVYKARDQRLDRFVAIKVLPPELVADPDRKRRFVQEAKAASALNHPNIITIHDVARDNGQDFMVMEFVAGKTLGEVIPRRGLKLSEALKYAVQIADGLAKAHGAGIIHRDLKPGNIMITDEGVVKVLDFGLAKLIERTRAREDESTITISSPTEEGTVLGTAAYMSPEQAAGKPVDARSDVFSFGSVLYEMVTGQRAFQADSKMSTLAAILNQEPRSAREITRVLPYDLEKIITRCLRKEPSHRFQHMDDLRVELDELLQTQGDSASQADSTPKGIKRHKPLAWSLAAILLLAGILLAVAYLPRAPADLRSSKLSVLLPETARLDSHAISPDGRQLAFVAAVGDKVQLWVRPLDSLSAKPQAGTEGAQHPFWSADGRYIGFFTKDKLKKIAVASGAVESLSDINEARGGTWSKDGEIVFAPRISDAPLYRIAAAGGKPVPVTALDRSRQENAHRWPWFLPDGRHFLYYVRSSRRDQQGIYLGSLDSNEKRRLLSAIGGMAYATPGYLLYVQNGTLVAQPFDPNRLEITGEPLSIVEQVKHQPGWSAHFSISATDVLTYRPGSNLSDTQLVWFDRGGKQLQAISVPADYQENFSLSPQGTRIAGRRVDPEIASGDIWLLEFFGGRLSRFTDDPSYEYLPIWSPEGDRIVFSSVREGHADLYVKLLNSSGDSQPLLKSDTAKYPEDWSFDGRFILYSAFDPETNQLDLWVLPLFGDRKPEPFLRTPFEEKQAQFSPDGRWVAYCSDESGKDEVYVQSFPLPGNKVLISVGGGRKPRWRRDGKELFYLSDDGQIMVLDMKAGPTLTASIPKALPLRVEPGLGTYSVTADGQRFLIPTGKQSARAEVINIVLNWTADLRKRR